MRGLMCAVGVAVVATGVATAQEKAATRPPVPIAVAQEPVAPAVCEGIIPAPPAEVWKVFATGEGFKKLGVAKAEVDLKIGGLIRSHYSPDGVLGDEGTIQNRIIAFEPERMMTIRIHQPPKGFPFPNAWKDAWTVITFTDLGDDRTHLRLAMLGFSGDEESLKMREFFQKGNDWTLKKLQSAFGGDKPQGPAHAAGPLDPIVLESVIPAAREDVWRAYTTSAGWKEFIGAETKIGSRPGDPFEIYFGMEAPAGQRGSEGCTVLAVVPGELFSYTWNAPPKFGHARGEHTWVVLEFEPVSGSATRVRLRHLGFSEQAATHPDHKAEWEEVRAYFSNAWPKVLGALQSHFSPPEKKAGG